MLVMGRYQFVNNNTVGLSIFYGIDIFKLTQYTSLAASTVQSRTNSDIRLYVVAHPVKQYTAELYIALSLLAFTA